MQAPVLSRALWVLTGLVDWVGIKELKLNEHNPETVLFTIYPEYGNLNYISKFLSSNPVDEQEL